MAVEPIVIEGALDLIHPFGFSGWIFDPTHPADAIAVDILIGEQFITTVTADFYRKDLAAAGIGDGHHGFHFRSEARLTAADIDNGAIRVRVAGTWRIIKPLRKITVDGALEVVGLLQVRGWACDLAQPDMPLLVEILSGDEVLATTIANLYRADLEKDNLAKGLCSFVLNFDQPRSSDEISSIWARVVASDGSHHRLHEAFRNTATFSPRIVRPFDGKTQDETQFPVFILGSARSGTSAMVQGLLKTDKFEGHEEGHLLDLIAHIEDTTVNFFKNKSIDITEGLDTMVSRVPPAFFFDAFDNVYVELAKRLFNTPHWVEKTPNLDMVRLAPHFKKLWPNAKFIFMRRRFLENVTSRARQFSVFDFHDSCLEWKDIMSTWLQIRNTLTGAALEIDQKYLSINPEKISQEVSSFLRLSEAEQQRLTQALKNDLPSRTTVYRQEGLELSDMNWSENQNHDFVEICGDLMDKFGYSTDRNYFKIGAEDQGFVYV